MSNECHSVLNSSAIPFSFSCFCRIVFVLCFVLIANGCSHLKLPLASHGIPYYEGPFWSPDKKVSLEVLSYMPSVLEIGRPYNYEAFLVNRTSSLVVISYRLRYEWSMGGNSGSSTLINLGKPVTLFPKQATHLPLTLKIARDSGRLVLYQQPGSGMVIKEGLNVRVREVVSYWLSDAPTEVVSIALPWRSLVLKETVKESPKRNFSGGRSLKR